MPFGRAFLLWKMEVSLMNIIICDDYDDMSEAACGLVIDALRANPEGLISFPGGDTPLGMFEAFVDAVNSREVNISRASYVSLDEWVGLSAEDEGSCGHFNKVNLVDELDYTFANLHIINGAAADIEQEKNRLNDFINTHGPLEVSVLGIGLNGHLGFNEEGVSFESDAHITPLATTTKTVMTKYFGDKFKPEHGLTQGIGQIMQAKTVILLANGAHKAKIIKQAIEGEVTNSLPASVLQQHPNCYIVIDREAAKELA